MKVAPTEMLPRMSDLNKPSLTWMSWLSRMVILISPASVDQGWTVVKFKFFSRSTLLYFVIYFGPMLLAVIVSFFNGEIIQFVTKCFFDTLATYNVMDSISLFVMTTALPLSTMIPFAAFTGVPSISSLALAEDLLWPKYGLWPKWGSLNVHGINVIQAQMRTSQISNSKKGEKFVSWWY